MGEPKRHQPTEEDGRLALKDHVVDRAIVARNRHGQIRGLDAVAAYLADTECVRYPTELVFASESLLNGEFAWCEAKGDHPREGFRLHVHPAFRKQDEILPALVAYHVVRVNYGDIASHEEAELYGAALLNMEVDDYYAFICRAADALVGAEGCSR